MSATADRTVFKGDTKIFNGWLWTNRYQQAPFTLTGAAIVGTVHNPDGSTAQTMTCAVLTADPVTGFQNGFSAELTAASSGALALGNYDYSIVATMADTRVYTLLTGTLTIEAR